MNVLHANNSLTYWDITGFIVDVLTGPWNVNCGPFWEELSSSGGCYQFHEEQKTYADAQNFCSQYGGNLASITTVAEQNYIQGEMISPEINK